MPYIVVGLGNPGEEYENTRHNTGRIMLERFRSVCDFPEWKEDKKNKALISKGKIGKETVLLIEPDNFMNNSGKSVAPFITGKKQAERTVVVYDDIDLPLGTIRVAFNRSSGGHNGVESVIKNLKTREFVRIRVGVSKMTAKGVAKKPKGEEAVLKFLLGEFKKDEHEELKKVAKKVSAALEAVVLAGREKAMGEFNRA
ncbi:MAG: aminoacyl-tRNA hydrolase [Parcubacteria group bacterium]|nr:aminoacyl-tRNA hydrolase [Parcubacteria group bacterium]